MALVFQSVYLSVPTCLSLPRLSGAACTNLSGRWGGWLFTCHLRDAQAIQFAAHNAESEPCETQLKNPCGAIHGPDSPKNPRVSCLSASTFCRAPLEELCIFYLSLEIRLDPDESIGCAHRHILSPTHIHAHKWASFCC